MQNLRDQYSRIIKAGNQPEQALNELRNQSTSTTTTRQSETPIIGHGNQPKQDLNEPRNPNISTTNDETNGNQNTMENIEQQDEPEYIALLNAARRWYEITKSQKGKGWKERQQNTFPKRTPDQ